MVLEVWGADLLPLILSRFSLGEMKRKRRVDVHFYLGWLVASPTQVFLVKLDLKIGLVGKSGATTKFSGLYLSRLVKKAGCMLSCLSQGRVNASSTSHILSQADQSELGVTLPASLWEVGPQPHPQVLNGATIRSWLLPEEL